MILARENAREFIRKQYPGMAFRITKQCTIGVRPTYEVATGLPVLAWRKLPTDGCRVHIGKMLPNGSIDWTYNHDAK